MAEMCADISDAEATIRVKSIGAGRGGFRGPLTAHSSEAQALALMVVRPGRGIEIERKDQI